MAISQDQVQINDLLKIGNFALFNIIDTNKGVLTHAKHLAKTKIVLKAHHWAVKHHSERLLCFFKLELVICRATLDFPDVSLFILASKNYCISTIGAQGIHLVVVIDELHCVD